MPGMNEDYDLQILSISGLLGGDIRNYENDELGSVKDIMIDASTGEVAYVILSAGGLLGIGERLLAVPWYALEPDPNAKCLRLSIDKESLKEAPGFDKENWPDMTNLSWGRRIHDYFRSTQYRNQ